MTATFFKHHLLALFILACSACSDRGEDHSLPVDAYIAFGMPDPSRDWSFEDYTQAHNVLAKIKWTRPLGLPTRDSERSGALFGHMVSLEYLSFTQDSTLSLNQKAERISEFARVYDYWIDAYTNPTLRGSYYRPEIMEIQLFNLGLAEAMLNLAHQINDSEDPADIALRYGYPAIKENYMACLNNILTTQRRTSEFMEHDLEKAADSIFDSAMRNRASMDSSAAAELARSLRSVSDSTSSDYIRMKYGELKKILIAQHRRDLKPQLVTQ